LQHALVLVCPARRRSCYLYNSPAHKAMAHALLERYPALIETVYDSAPTLQPAETGDRSSDGSGSTAKHGPYYGENVLHMVRARGDLRPC
jgi:hypothetical protein